MQFIIILIIFLLMFRIIRNFINRPTFSITQCSCTYLFGVPGCGKTTTLAMYAKKLNDLNVKNLKYNQKLFLKLNRKYKNNVDKVNSVYAVKSKKIFNIYSNANLTGIDYIKINVRDNVGKHLMENGYLLIDEASVEYNNRMIKSFSYDAIKFFKYHRHFNINILVFSQSYDDVDITIRRLCPNYIYIKKSPLYFLTKSIVLKKVRKILTINKEDKQIIDGYAFQVFGKYIYRGSKYFKNFNSFERYYLPPLPDCSDKEVNII